MGNVQSVERSLAILRCLAGTEAGVSQLSDLVGLPKSTVSRLLATLQDLGAVEPTENGYRIGALMAEIAGGANRTDALISLARPYLAGLVGATGEDAGLSVLQDGEVVYLAQVNADTHVQVRDWTGVHLPPHCVSSGLVLLAHAPVEEQRRVLARPLPRFTPRTVTSPAKLRRRLAEVAQQDSEWVYGEFATDIDSVAAAVLDGEGHAVAALHVHGPSYRFPGERDPKEIAALVAAAAQRMGARWRR
jgi:DNA-binding IclR family transcriptional regulator